MSKNPVLATPSQILLNGQHDVRNFSAEISNTIQTVTTSSYSCTAMFFSAQYVGKNSKDNLEYRIKVKRRLFLDKKGRPVFKHSKAQMIALAVAKINDELVFEVSEAYRLLGISNSNTIRKAWQAIRTSLLKTYPDLEALCVDFDRQLQTDTIQKLFLKDNFYNLFFANLFYQKFEKEKLPHAKKVLANGFEELDIPIIERRNLAKQDMLFQNITVETEAALDTENEKFPLEKMNEVLGLLIGEIGSKHNLEFTYKGAYQLKPRIGLITSGTLEYEFNIPEVYQKKTSINFNLEK